MKPVDPVDFIKTNAGILTTSEIAERLGKTPNSVLCMAKRRGISLLVNDQSYTPEEDAYIVENISILSFEDMSTIMSTTLQTRSKDSIRQRASALGISGQHARKTSVFTNTSSSKFGEKWMPQDDAYIVLIQRKILDYKSAAHHSGRTVESVRYRYKNIDQDTPEYSFAEKIADKLLHSMKLSLTTNEST